MPLAPPRGEEGKQKEEGRTHFTAFAWILQKKNRMLHSMHLLLCLSVCVHTQANTRTHTVHRHSLERGKKKKDRQESRKNRNERVALCGRKNPNACVRQASFFFCFVSQQERLFAKMAERRACNLKIFNEFKHHMPPHDTLLVYEA